MKFKFQSFVDIQTSAQSMQVIQWSVGGSEVVNRCRHLFGAYKYFKLGKINIKMVPASTLPVDPQGLSYDADDPQTVDPRDQMNPGLVRITNGEDIFTNVSALSDEQQRAMYTSMMLDPRWSKFMLQSGFRRSAYPMYWQVGQLHQDKYPGATVNTPIGQAPRIYDTVANAMYRNSFADSVQGTLIRAYEGSSAHGLFQVGHKGRLGFLPTDFYQSLPSANDSDKWDNVAGINNVPEVSVVTCVLPKAYKTIYYYRVFITEEVIFSGLRSSPAIVPAEGLPYGASYLGIDQFTFGSVGGIAPGTRLPNVLNPNGGNNGDDLP